MVGLYLKVLRFEEEVLVNDLSVTIGVAGGTIGRAQTNDLVLPDTAGFVSRTHIRIENEGEEFFIIDCSSNGTILLEPTSEGIEGEFNEITLYGEKKKIRFDGYIIVGDFEILVQHHESLDSQSSQHSHSPTEQNTEKDLLTGRLPHTSQEQSRPNAYQKEHYEAESLEHVSVLQSSISISKAKEEELDDEIPDTFNIDDFFTENIEPLEECSKENLLAGLQNPEEDTGKVEVVSLDQGVGLADTTQNLTPSASVEEVLDDCPSQSNHKISGMHSQSDRKLQLGEPAEQDVAQSYDNFVFFESLGVDTEKLPKDKKELDLLMSETGKMLRSLLESNMALLRARADIKREISSSMTVIQKEENNPLKLCQSIDEALSQLFFEKKLGFLSRQDAIDESCHDLQSHQMAMMSGIQSALNGTVRLFDPIAVENNSETGRFNKGSKNWDYYASHYKIISDNARADFFGADFSAAYEQQVRAMKKPK